MIRLLERANQRGVELVVFPELALTRASRGTAMRTSPRRIAVSKRRCRRMKPRRCSMRPAVVESASTWDTGRLL
jgi:hypothetical protein